MSTDVRSAPQEALNNRCSGVNVNGVLPPELLGDGDCLTAGTACAGISIPMGILVLVFGDGSVISLDCSDVVAVVAVMPSPVILAVFDIPRVVLIVSLSVTRRSQPQSAYGAVSHI